MFFFLPYSTDAPLYHRPLGTIALIVINALVWGLAVGGVFDPDPWRLEYGTIQPLQWVTSNFLHGGIFHLAGNLFFLWVFGLIVEGKVGTPVFLLLYLGIGVVQSGAEQLLFLAWQPADASLGASGIIFGLLAIAVLWAPENEVSVFYFVWVIFLRVGKFEVRMKVLASVYLAWQLLILAFFGLFGHLAGSELIHVMGAAVGLPVGIVMLRRGWVDCQGWDWFSVRRGEHLRPIARRRAEEELVDADTPPVDPEAERTLVLEMIDSHLDAGDPGAALETYHASLVELGHWELDEERLWRLIAVLDENGAPERVPLMARYLRRFGFDNPEIALRLATALIHERNQPARARDLLARIPTFFTAEQRERRDRLLDEAERRIDAGTLELDDSDW